MIAYVCEKTHVAGGIFDYVITSNNISFNVKLNGFITSSDHSFIHFSLSIVKQRKSQHQLMFRNRTKFDFEGFVKLLKPCLKFGFASSFDEAWDMYLMFENILDTVLPHKIKTFTKHQCQFFDDELLSLKRKKRKAQRKFRKFKKSVLKFEYEKTKHLFFEKLLEKRRLYIENAVMEDCGRRKFATLKFILDQDVEQFPINENTKKLANESNEFFISKVDFIIASIPTAVGPEIMKAEVKPMNSFTKLSISHFIDLILASSTSIYPLNIIPTHLVMSFPHKFFLELLKFLIFR